MPPTQYQSAVLTAKHTWVNLNLSSVQSGLETAAAAAASGLAIAVTELAHQAATNIIASKSILTSTSLESWESWEREIEFQHLHLSSHEKSGIDTKLGRSISSNKATKHVFDNNRAHYDKEPNMRQKAKEMNGSKFQQLDGCHVPLEPSDLWYKGGKDKNGTKYQTVRVKDWQIKARGVAGNEVQTLTRKIIKSGDDTPYKRLEEKAVPILTSDQALRETPTKTQGMTLAAGMDRNAEVIVSLPRSGEVITCRSESISQSDRLVCLLFSII